MAATLIIMSSVTTPPPLPSQSPDFSADDDDDINAVGVVAALDLDVDEDSKYVDFATVTRDTGSGAGAGSSPSVAPPPIEAEQQQQQQNLSSAETTITTTEGAKASKSIELKRVTKISFNFKSDIDQSPRRRGGKATADSDSDSDSATSTENNEVVTFDTASSGIIHACRCGTHAFGWISNINDATSTSSVVEYLQKNTGHRSYSISMKFIPYSSYQHWVARYPHAIPVVECDIHGKLHVNASFGDAASKQHGGGKRKTDAVNSEDNNKKKKAAKKLKSKTPPKLIANGYLHNSERDVLHREIHQYFTWLHDELVTMETHATGRRLVSNAGVSVPALRSVVSKLEGAFRAVVVQQQSGGANKVHGGGGGAGLPFLEQALQSELERKVRKTSPGGGGDDDDDDDDDDENKIHFRSLDFDTLYQKLVEFKGKKGHASPLMRHPVLGRWVAELRAAKKGLRDRGLEYEEEEKEKHHNDDALMSANGVSTDDREEFSNDPPSLLLSTKKPKKNGITYLSQSRVQRLDAISFAWTVLSPRVTWDERLEELKQFRQREGRFPTTKEGAIGNWLKAQRKLYTKNDADFMMNKCPKLEEIGVLMRQRPYANLSWEDRFQQLVEFGRVNRHFNVPNPDNGLDNTIIDPSSEAADAKRFYKFVLKLNTDYRALQRGIPSTVLTEERIEQLLNIGFVFSTKPAQKTVPDLDWNTRIQQLEAFSSEMGHLRVDPNYDKYSNLGGWAVEISSQYTNWREGREYQPPEAVEKFNQLSAMGFGFDVFPIGRGHRSWEESFNLLLQYRQETGSTRVPHHYKADFRLGSWVAVQRKEYKLSMEGKPSRITQERIHQLESVGFEWVARRGYEN